MLWGAFLVSPIFSFVLSFQFSLIYFGETSDYPHICSLLHNMIFYGSKRLFWASVNLWKVTLFCQNIVTVLAVKLIQRIRLTNISFNMVLDKQS